MYIVLSKLQSLRLQVALVTLDTPAQSDLRDVTATQEHLVYQELKANVGQLEYLVLLVRQGDQVTEAYLVLMASLVTRDHRESKDFLAPWDLLEPEACW